MRLFVVSVHFDGQTIERVYSAKDAWEAIDKALAEYPTATGAGAVPEQNWIDAH